MVIRRRLVALGAAMLVACNALLGIDGDVIEGSEAADGGPDGATTDAAAVRLPSQKIVIRQGEMLSFEVTLEPNTPPAPGRAVRIAPTELVPGLELRETRLVEGTPGTLVLVASAFARRGAIAPTLMLDDGSSIGALSIEVTGNLDTTFGDGGIAELPSTLLDQAFDDFGLAVEQGTGRIVVASRTTGSGADVPMLAAFDKQGKLDTTFAANGVLADTSSANGRFKDVAFLPSGVLVATGQRKTGAKLEPYVTVVNAEGTIVARPPVPRQTEDELNAVAAASDGRLWVFGTSVTGTFLGMLTSSSGAEGYALQSTTELSNPNRAVGLAVTNESQPLLIGSRGSQAYLLKRLLDGGADPSFGASGEVRLNVPGLTERFNKVVVDDSARVLTAGHRIDFDAGTTHAASRRYGANGAADPSFGDGGLIALALADAGEEALAQGVASVDGRVVVAGYVGALNSPTSKRRIVVYRLLENGELDNAFALGGIVAIDRTQRSEGRRVARQGKDVIVAAYVTEGFNASRIILLRFNP